MAIITNSFPENLVMMGSVVSMVVAPPADMGASFPIHITSNGASNRVNISRIMFDIKAMTPNSAPLYWVMKMLDRE